MFLSSDLTFAIAGGVPEGHCKEHVPMYCGIQYNHRGVLQLQIGDNPELRLEGAWVFITYPGIRFRYRLVGEQPHEFRFICMKPETVKEYIDSGLLPLGKTPIRINFSDKFSHCMNDAIALINSGVTERYPRAVWRVIDLLLQLREQDAGSVKVGSWQDARLKALMEELRRHPERPLDFSREAAKMNVTDRHFRRLFKSAAGLAPTQFQLQCRLNKALTLLSETHEPVGTVGALVGIDDPYYFSTLFKQRFHLSPRAYRQEFYHDAD